MVTNYKMHFFLFSETVGFCTIPDTTAKTYTYTSTGELGSTLKAKCKAGYSRDTNETAKVRECENTGSWTDVDDNDSICKSEYYKSYFTGL